MADADDLVLEISGIRPDKGNPVLVNSDAAAMRLVADFGGHGKHTHCSSHFKATKKTLNTFKSSVRLAAGSGSAFRTELEMSLKSERREDADVHLIIYALDDSEVKKLDGGKEGVQTQATLGKELGRARASCAPF